jgi:hypothetical protein
MTAFSKVSCARFALCATLLACACERDSEALFDDSMLTGQSGGGSGPAAAGSQGKPIAGDGGDESSGGAETAGSSSEAGTGGTSAGGREAGGMSSGGAATAGGAGKPGAGDGGSSGSAAGMGGTGGTKDPPQPVTVTISAFDDAYIASCMPYSNFGNAASLNVDYDNHCAYQALLTPVLKELPEGAIVSEAKLSLYCINAGGALALNYVDDAWSENEVRYMGRPDVGTSIGTLTCKDKGPVTLDVTTVLQVWLTGQHPGYGVYIRTEASDGTDFGSSEAADADTRPSLTVTYTLPPK